MILKGLYDILSYKLKEDNNKITVKRMGGSTSTISSTTPSPFSGMGSFSAGAEYYGIHVGSGTTPPTFDDYCLESRISHSNFSFNATVSSSFDSNGKYSMTSVVTLINKTSSEFTITEIGLGAYLNGSVVQAVLIDRTLLETPVTIPANGVGQITYTIDFDYTEL